MVKKYFWKKINNLVIWKLIKIRFLWIIIISNVCWRVVLMVYNKKKRGEYLVYEWILLWIISHFDSLSCKWLMINTSYQLLVAKVAASGDGGAASVLHLACKFHPAGVLFLPGDIIFFLSFLPSFFVVNCKHLELVWLV